MAIRCQNVLYKPLLSALCWLAVFLMTALVTLLTSCFVTKVAIGDNEPNLTEGAGQLSRLIAVAILIGTFNGCVSIEASRQIATREEPQEVKSFLLTADKNAYTVSRWWGTDHETVAIPRTDLPAGCETARFFLNDSTHELRVAEPVNVNWLVGAAAPPLPDEGYPPCSLLVSYGFYPGPPELEGVAVTSPTGLVAKGDRIRPHPAVYVLTPAVMMVEGYAIVGAIWTLPIWGPIVLLSGQNKEEERSKLPPPVTACWTAIDDKVKNGWSCNLNMKITEYEWSSKKENAYLLTAANELFSDDNPVPIDSRVTLHQGRIYFNGLGSDADIECGLQSGNVVSIKLKPLL